MAYLESLALVTCAQTLFPNKAPFTGSRWTSLLGHHSAQRKTRNPHPKRRSQMGSICPSPSSGPPSPSVTASLSRTPRPPCSRPMGVLVCTGSSLPPPPPPPLPLPSGNPLRPGLAGRAGNGRHRASVLAQCGRRLPPGRSPAGAGAGRAQGSPPAARCPPATPRPQHEAGLLPPHFCKRGGPARRDCDMQESHNLPLPFDSKAAPRYPPAETKRVRGVGRDLQTPACCRLLGPPFPQL